MRRKALLLTLPVSVLLLTTGCVVLYLLMHQEPAFYRAAEVPPGPERVAKARALEAEVQDFLYARIPGKRRGWELRFTQDQINSYLAEDFPDSQLREELPTDILEPRVVAREDRLHIAFRYGQGYWSSIVTMELRVWLPDSDEPKRTIAIELCSLKAGSLPISSRHALEEISAWASRNDLDITWEEQEGNPVAMLRPSPEGDYGLMTFTEVQVKAGEILVRGGSAVAPELVFGTQHLMPR